MTDAEGTGPARDLYETQAPTSPVPCHGASPRPPAPSSPSLYETRAPEPVEAPTFDQTSDHVHLGGPPSGAPSGSSHSAPRFRVVRPHARGGLGEVLVASDQELHREVALKQIQDRFADDTESRLRFLLEAEITGGLEHPGIVPVYSLGTYPDGRPYYAMRFIRGESLKEAIDCYHVAADNLPPEGRALGLRHLLNRFVAVCNAMAYAHSRGVIHRDIKPHNIMLGPYGETLVVDWGLAKPLNRDDIKAASPEGALSPAAASVSLPTLMGSAVGTPQFMSPEQAAGRVDELGPASDIYSLGATLYYLLTGRPAAEGPDLLTLLQKVQRGDLPPPRQARPEVPQPLEAICLKAMALAPEARYPSALALAGDIEHWLADEPVSAWQEPWYVRARRWVNRNRTLVTSVASALLVALVGLAVATGLLQAANSRERAARALAEENYSLARRAVDRYHTRVSEEVLLDQPGMEPLRRRLLEDARDFYSRFVEEHEDDPRLRGEMGKALYRLARITADIGPRPEAIELLTRARAAFAELAEAEPDAREPREGLADCDHHLGRLYRLADDLDRAEHFGARAVAGWEALARDHPDTPRYMAGLAQARNVLANVHQVRRHLGPAVALDQQALEGWKKLLAREPKNAEYRRHLALSQHHIGMVYNDLNQVKKAEEAFGLALEARKGLAAEFPNVGRYRDDLASTWFNLGDLHNQAGQTKRAAGPFGEAAALWATLVEQHPDVLRYRLNLAEAQSALVGIHLKAGELARAEQAAALALAHRQRLAAAHPRDAAYQNALADSHFRLGDIRRDLGRPEQAEAEYRQALRLQEKLTRGSPKIALYRADAARSHNNLGLLALRAKRWEDAGAAFLAALAHWEGLAKAHPREVEYALGLSATCCNLGNVRSRAGKAEDALPWYGRALAALEGRFRPGQYTPAIKDELSHALKGRGEALTQLGRYKEALADLGRAVELAPRKFRPWFQLSRARTVALSGDHRAAAAAVAEMAPKASRSGEACFLLAGVCSLASSAAAEDGGLAPDARKAAAERHAARAVGLLRLAKEAGFFRSPANVKRLYDGPDFAAIRARADVAELLRGLAAKSGS